MPPVSATPAQGLSYAKSNGLLTGTAVTASTADYALTKLGCPVSHPCSGLSAATCLRETLFTFS